ncbi:MAG: class I SAM-dependent methyltransferase [Spirulina sp.]
MSPEIARDYFDFIAKVGLTKHGGSMAATRELISLCHIESGQAVLDVGCGMGATSCYLAKATNCRVVGVDLLEKAIEQSRERAKAEKVTDRVEFKVADARKLPFEDSLFDAVISESVNVFFADKREAISEYMRVTKSGGYVGINEITWLKPPSPEVEGYLKRAIYAEALDAKSWTKLMEEAGLQEIVSSPHPFDIPVNTKGMFELYGGWRIFQGMLKMLVLFVRDPKARGFLKSGTGGISKDMFDAIGYGVYVGRKGSF